MRLLSIVFILFFVGFNSLKAQNIFPYLEVKNTTDFQKISSDSVHINSKFNHFLNDVEYTYYFTNISDENLDLRFIVPQHHSQNINQLNANYADKVVKLQAKPIATVRREIKALKAKSGYENLEIAQNSILLINDVASGKQLIITLKFAKIIDANYVLYQTELPDPYTIRTAEFTATASSNLKTKPKSVQTNLTFTGSLPIDHISINNKKETLIKDKHNHWEIQSNKIQKFKIDYQYKADEISSSIQHFSVENCDYVLGIVQPPKVIETISPREFIFVIDASGSMKGRPIEEVKKMMKSVLKQLKPNELFNILVYATNQEHFAKNPVVATPENIDSAILYLEKEYGKGAMKLNEAIDFIQKFNPNPTYNRVITIVSDGDLDINENLHLAIKSHAKSAQFFILGIGNSVDYRAMNFLSLSTGTDPIVIGNEYEMVTKVNLFKNLILKPLLRNVQVQSKNINLTETFPKNFNGFLSITPLHFVTKDCRKVYPKQLEITAKNGQDNYHKTFNINQPNSSNFTEAIKFYWVKQKIDFLMKDEDRCGDLCKNDGRYRKEIERLGLENNLSTPYTILMQSNLESSFNQDYDTDQDGIADWYDDCINEKGTLLTKGCPVTQLLGFAKDIYIQDFSNELIRSIEFDFDQTKIRPVDFPILEKIVKIMQANPTLNFMIEGHTDARGTQIYNNDLSTKRAEAVLDYLILKGLNKNRFTIIGKGFTALKYPECKPSELCEEWKNLANRRVEFKLKKD